MFATTGSKTLDITVRAITVTAVAILVAFVLHLLGLDVATIIGVLSVIAMTLTVVVIVNVIIHGREIRKLQRRGADAMAYWADTFRDSQDWH